MLHSAPQRKAWTARGRAVVRSCAKDERPPLPAGTGPARPTVENFGFVGAEKLGVSFTCTVNECGTRISKMIRRSSYEKGTVLIQCPKCKSRHIISDHLNWYTDVDSSLTDIEKIAESKGERVVRVNSNVFDLESLISKFPSCNTDIRAAIIFEHVGILTWSDCAFCRLQRQWKRGG